MENMRSDRYRHNSEPMQFRCDAYHRACRVYGVAARVAEESFEGGAFFLEGAAPCVARLEARAIPPHELNRHAAVRQVDGHAGEILSKRERLHAVRRLRVVRHNRHVPTTEAW